MTLNGYFALNSVFASVNLAGSKRAKNNCVKTNKDRDILSGRQSSAVNLVYANIRSGSLERRQRRVGSCVNATDEHLFFENNCVKLDTDRPIM